MFTLAQATVQDVIGSGVTSGITTVGVMFFFIRYLTGQNEKKHDENKAAIKENTEAVNKLASALNKQTELGLLQLIANPNFPHELHPKAEQLKREVI